MNISWVFSDVDFQGKAINQISSLLLKEGILIKPAQDGKKATERKTFLFDNLLVCTKQVRFILAFLDLHAFPRVFDPGWSGSMN